MRISDCGLRRSITHVAITMIGMAGALLAVVTQKLDAAFHHNRAAGDTKAGFRRRRIDFHWDTVPSCTPV